MSSVRCIKCGLVNFSTQGQCKRCGASLKDDLPVEAENVEETPPVKKRGLGRRISWILGMTAVILTIYYLSLLATSTSIKWQERQVVDRAISILEQKGFAKETFVLRHLVSFRTTDNWWNTQVGHHDAYAATNFPFEIVTLYPEFFDSAADDTERAVILLHESHHLFGSGEAAALEGVWREKARVGWTADKYGETKLWRNTRELTINLVPKLFRCGLDQKSDCLP